MTRIESIVADIFAVLYVIISIIFCLVCKATMWVYKLVKEAIK